MGSRICLFLSKLGSPFNLTLCFLSPVYDIACWSSFEQKGIYHSHKSNTIKSLIYIYFNFGLRKNKMLAVMACLSSTNLIIENCTIQLLYSFFFLESRKFHAMARALPDAIKSAARQISRMLSPFRFD